jgi:hypothetical protein
MALEETPSRLAALRNEYALGLDYLSPGELPEILVRWYEAPWRVEVHVLYEDGQESRRQWIFRDSAGMARLVAVFDQDLLNLPPPEPAAGPASGASGEAPLERAAEGGGEEAAAELYREPEAPPRRILTGFIERYNEDGQIIAEDLLLEGGEETGTVFFYRRRQLIRAEMRRKPPSEGGGQTIPVFTDFYRYSRSDSLRMVERIYHEGAEAGSPVRLRFPHMVLAAAADKNFIGPGAFYATGFPEEFLIGEADRVVYTTDNRGRILTEIRQNNTGAVIAELFNTWTGERLSSVLLKAGNDEWLTEYTYNSRGDRVIERNYRGGVLERMVRIEGDREVEELFMNGVIILRAIWEGGRKISEERIRGGP